MIEKAGGCVMMNAPIDRILTDSRRRVTGVRVGDVEIQSSIVISDAGTKFKSLNSLFLTI